VRSRFLGASLALWSIAAGVQAQSAHRFFEASAGGGLSWISPDPSQLDLSVGGQLSGRVAIDVLQARAEAQIIVPDPTRWENLFLRADGRLLVLTVHDLTYRRDVSGELIRFQAGFGGDIDMPDQSGHLMIDAGFSMIRHAPSTGVFTEAYGAYLGATLRLHIGPVTNETRFALHAMFPPPQISLDFSLDTVWASIQGGVTVSDRIYLHVIEEGPVSAGPELLVQVEQLPEGAVILSTLSVVGTLGG